MASWSLVDRGAVVEHTPRSHLSPHKIACGCYFLKEKNDTHLSYMLKEPGILPPVPLRLGRWCKVPLRSTRNKSIFKTTV